MKKFIFQCIVFFRSLQKVLQNYFGKKKSFQTLGILVEEFFHEDLGGFGGYGITVKNVTGFLNASKSSLKAEVLLTRIYSHSHIEVKQYYDAPVIFRPRDVSSYVLNFVKYSGLVNQRELDFLLTIDWYPSYEYSALALAKTPIIIWIKDPRGMEEWQKISGVPLEFAVIGNNYEQGKFADIVQRKKNSIQRLLKFAKCYRRKIIFAAQAQCLVQRAQRSYGLPSIDAFFLPNPIAIEGVSQPNFSKRPSVCLLGRLEPIKRPWIFFELAKRFQDIDFLVAGKAHFPELMAPVIEKYQNLPNLKFLGMIGGKEKHDLLNSVWALMNTSIHEALPVSFLEAFCYCKPVISCQNPDDLAHKFGYSTGEILGEGNRKEDLDRFSEGIEQIIYNEPQRLAKGLKAKKHVQENYSFEKFRTALTTNLNRILK